jgi:hypothetical protein
VVVVASSAPVPSWRSGSLTVITSLRLIGKVGVDARSDRLEPDGLTLVGRAVPIGSPEAARRREHGHRVGTVRACGERRGKRSRSGHTFTVAATVPGFHTSE